MKALPRNYDIKDGYLLDAENPLLERIFDVFKERRYIQSTRNRPVVQWCGSDCGKGDKGDEIELCTTFLLRPSFQNLLVRAKL